MRSTKKDRFSVAVLLLAMLCALSAINPTLASGNNVKSKQSYLSVFHSVPWGQGRNVSEEAEKFLLGVPKEDALEVLKVNGFTVISEITRSGDPEAYERYAKHENVQHDAIIIAERGAGWRFWRFGMEYRSILYIRENQVVKVVARSDTSIFP